MSTPTRKRARAKVRKNILLSPDAAQACQQMAKMDHCSVSNFIETLVLRESSRPQPAPAGQEVVA